MKTKKIALIVFVMMLIALLATGCTGTSSNKKSESSSSSSAPTSSIATIPNSQTTTTKPSALARGKSIIIFFSQTGNTKDIAEKIATSLDADLLELTPKIPYGENDLRAESIARAQIEQMDPHSRPELNDYGLKIDDYSNIFIGYPIWSGEAPRLMYTFIESQDLDGLNIIPFCTSTLTPLGDSALHLKEVARGGNWHEGKRFEPQTPLQDVQAWIQDL